YTFNFCKFYIKTFIYIANELLLNNKNTIQSLLCKQIEWYGSAYGFFKIYVTDLQGSFLIHLENNNLFGFYYVVIIFSYHIFFSEKAEHTSHLNNICKCFWVFFINNIF